MPPLKFLPTQLLSLTILLYLAWLSLCLLSPLTMACGCCCAPHHAFTSHNKYAGGPSFVPPPPSEDESTLPWVTLGFLQAECEEDDLPLAPSLVMREGLVGLLTSVNVDFSVDG